MSGLRVYVNSSIATLPNGGDVKAEVIDVGRVFYSRRGNGPIYCWRYEEKGAHWRPLRMHDINPHRLSNASWKSVPEKLQAQLGAHYLD